MSKEAEITVKDGEVYELRMVISKEDISKLLKDGYGYRENLSNHITAEFAKKYVIENYAELKKLIDLDLIKLLATRKLAGVVAGDEST